jgi:hypothetical protein
MKIQILLIFISSSLGLLADPVKSAQVTPTPQAIHAPKPKRDFDAELRDSTIFSYPCCLSWLGNDTDLASHGPLPRDGDRKLKKTNGGIYTFCRAYLTLAGC